MWVLEATELGIGKVHTVKTWAQNPKHRDIAYAIMEFLDVSRVASSFVEELEKGLSLAKRGHLFHLLYRKPNQPDQALRYNSGKPQLSFILEAPKAVEGTARVLEFGAQKYDRGNWKKGLPKEQIVDSLLRHLTKYMNGEEFDEESGHHHVYHVMCNAMFLAELYGKEKEV